MSQPRPATPPLLIQKRPPKEGFDTTTLRGRGLGEEGIEGLVAVLRRHDPAAAIALIEGWMPGDVDQGDHFSRSLTCWVRDQCRQHVADGRFEYALALIERYRFKPTNYMKEDEA